MTGPLPFSPALAPSIGTGLVVGGWLQDVAAAGGLADVLATLESLCGGTLRRVVFAWAVYAPQLNTGREDDLYYELAVGRVLVALARLDDLSALRDALGALTDGQVRAVALAWLVNGRGLMRAPADREASS